MMLNTALELLGVTCIALFAGSFHPRWALLIVGVWLVLTALARDTGHKEARTSDSATKPPRKA